MKLNKKNIVKLICLIWFVLWCNFILRELFFRADLFNKYSKLLLKNEESRRSQVYGESFYAFLKFARANLRENSTFCLRGVESFSLEYRRAVYYLYPALESEKAEYILVYKNPKIKKLGYKKIASLNKESFILKRI